MCVGKVGMCACGEVQQSKQASKYIIGLLFVSLSSFVTRNKRTRVIGGGGYRCNDLIHPGVTTNGLIEGGDCLYDDNLIIFVTDFGSSSLLGLPQSASTPLISF